MKENIILTPILKNFKIKIFIEKKLLF